MHFFNNLKNRLFRPDSLAVAARRAGYVSDQMGIRNRFLRENGNWQSHLDNTRRFIVEAATHTAGRQSVAVLGSGWLYDVPLEQLSGMFGSVTLVDIVHPESVKLKAERLPNVSLVCADLTGGAVLEATRAESFGEFLSWLPQASPALSFDSFDLVVSVNLLNQLDILLCDYLKERFGVSETELIPVRQLVQQQHIDWLPKHRSCLITDYMQIDKPLNGAPQTQTKLLYADLSAVGPFEEWEWVFDTSQRYSVKNNTFFKVLAVCF